jgi:hypothetical protein
MKKKKLKITESMMPTAYKPDSTISLEGDDCIPGVEPKDSITATVTMRLESMDVRTEKSGEGGKETIRKSQRWKINYPVQ